MSKEDPIIRKGAKVRFLDAVGGGVVVGFSDKNTVIVEDDNGFEVPVPARSVVVVDDGSDQRMQSAASASTSAKKKEPQAQGDTIRSLKKLLHDEEESVDTEIDTRIDDPADAPVTFRPTTQERKGGNKLNVYLCFEPVHPKDLGAGEWDMYVVNDSNYFIHLNILSGENNAWILRRNTTATQGAKDDCQIIEPNTTLLFETINRDTLNELQHICLQMLFYKERNPFTLKAPASIEMRLDLTRFYKWHLYQPNDFFLQPVLTFPLIENDRIVAGRVIQNTAETETLLPSATTDTAEGAKSHHVTINLDELRNRNAKTAASSPDTHGAIYNKEEKGKKENEVIDLHIDSLLDNTNGLSPKDILQYQIDTFRSKMDEMRSKKGKHLIFIHGKGEGVLRSKILSILKHDYPSCIFQDASFREYGFGATLVIIN